MQLLLHLCDSACFCSTIINEKYKRKFEVVPNTVIRKHLPDEHFGHLGAGHQKLKI